MTDNQMKAVINLFGLISLIFSFSYALWDKGLPAIAFCGIGWTCFSIHIGK